MGVVLQCNNYEVIDLGVMVPAAKILETARKQKADVIGLSGLITPSLDEMVHVAQEMEREGFQVPLLIGGATTSRAHTAVKIAPHYRSSIVHVLDASRAVGVVSSLLNEQIKPEFEAKTRADYVQLRDQYAAKTREKKLLRIAEARANRTPIDWSSYIPPKPEFLGVRALSSADATRSASPGRSKCDETFSLETLASYIDWSPFFHTWELRGRYPAIFDDPTVGKQARDLFDDAQKLLRKIIEEHLFVARGVHAFWPASAQGDDVKVYTDDIPGPGTGHLLFPAATNEETARTA